MKPSSGKPFLIAQISDMHIKTRGALSYRVVDTARFLREAIAHIKGLKQQPDVVVATGDLTDFGKPEEYALLREILCELPLPLYMIPATTTSAKTCAPLSLITPTCARAPISSSTRSKTCRCALSRWTP